MMTKVGKPGPMQKVVSILVLKAFMCLKQMHWEIVEGKSNLVIKVAMLLSIEAQT